MKKETPVSHVSLMRFLNAAFFAVVLVVYGLCGQSAYAASYRLERSIFLTMRDGVRLATDFYFPEGAKGHLPTILIRTPYGKDNYDSEFTGMLKRYLENGYAIAIQDVRGRFESEGAYVMWNSTRNDSFDTLDWLSKQSWSNGNIGTIGCSALGQAQIISAATRHPAHKAAIMSGHGGVSRVGDRYIRASAYENGVFEMAQNLGWAAFGNGNRYYPRLSADLDRDEYLALKDLFEVRKIERITPAEITRRLSALPVIDAMGPNRSGPFFEFWSDYVTNNPAAQTWAERDYVTDEDSFDVPTMHIGAWYDSNSDGTVQGYQLMKSNSSSKRSKANQYLIMHPGTHCTHYDLSEKTIVGDRDMGDARLPIAEMSIQWMDRWLKNKGSISGIPKVQAYEMGTNQWRSFSKWPPKSAESKTFFLTSETAANSLYGDGKLQTTPSSSGQAQDSFVYDPMVPVPTKGGAISFDGGGGDSGPFDHRDIAVRQDVLVYDTDVVTEPLTIAGQPQVTLYVSSSAVDTDFTAKLVDVTPSGKAYNLVETIVRMRWREGYDKEVFMEEGKVYPATLNLPSTFITLQKGHRLRLEVSSSSFPRFLRNLNTGGDSVTETKAIVATNAVHHSEEHRSKLTFPVLGDD